jgi:hypothetical protein
VGVEFGGDKALLPAALDAGAVGAAGALKAG